MFEHTGKTSQGHHLKFSRCFKEIDIDIEMFQANVYWSCGRLRSFIDQIYTCDYQLHFTVPNALPITNGEKTILMKEPSALSENATVLLFLPPL